MFEVGAKIPRSVFAGQQRVELPRRPPRFCRVSGEIHRGEFRRPVRVKRRDAFVHDCRVGEQFAAHDFHLGVSNVELIADPPRAGDGAVTLFGREFPNNAGVHQPRRMRALDATQELLARRRAARLVPQPAPRFRPHLAANGLRAPLLQRGRAGANHARHKEPAVTWPAGCHRCPRERIVVIAKPARVVRRVVTVAVADGIAQQDGRLLEGGLVGVHHFGLHCFARPEVAARMVVPLTPRTEQAGGDEADARIAVVTRAERSDEVGHRGAQPRVAVVGREAAAAIGVVGHPFRHLHALVEQELRHGARFADVFQIDSEYRLAAARGDAGYQPFQRLPVEGVWPDHQVLQREILELEAMRKLLCLSGVGHEALERIVRRRGRVFERRGRRAGGGEEAKQEPFHRRGA